ncbi:MAG: hypothetical protein N2690_08925, partial [Rhodocyclaceae bacterium]|nr:hypothetical protein [Rhodocyclaceae bacterium]
MITFRRWRRQRADRRLKRLDATRRFLDLVSDAAAGYILYGVQADSPLMPLIVWDLAHALALGQRIGFAGDAQIETFLDRAYFAGSFACEGQDERGVRWYSKTAPLPAQQDEGLDAWSFGIPVGPEDATIVNRCVQRILALGLPKFE